jgi:hypothetical protein
VRLRSLTTRLDRLEGSIPPEPDPVATALQQVYGTRSETELRRLVNLHMTAVRAEAKSIITVRRAAARAALLEAMR